MNGLFPWLRHRDACSHFIPSWFGRNRHSFFPIVSWACLSLLSSTAWADQLVMKNGDRVTGSIIKQDGKTITIKTQLFGLVTAAWDQVASIQSEQPVNVVLKNGKSVTGNLSTSEGTIDISSGNTKVEAAPAEVAAMRNADEQKAYERLLKPGLLQLWAGGASVGWAGTNGNAKTLTFTSALDAARVTNTDKTSIYFNLIKASALVNGVSASTAQAVRGGVAYDHNVSHRIFAEVFNDYEYDRFQNLDLRFVLGGGVGFHAVKTERAFLDLLGGADFDRATFSTPLTKDSAEAFWGDEYTLKLSGASSLIQSFRMFDDLRYTGTYRINFDGSLSSRLKKWMTWNVTLSDRYLSKPVPGRKTNDWLYSTGLGFTFGK